MSLWKSFRISSIDSPRSGGDIGRAPRTSPGRTAGRTGHLSGASRYSAIQSITAYPCFRNSAGDISETGRTVCDIGCSACVSGCCGVGFIDTNIEFPPVTDGLAPTLYLREWPRNPIVLIHGVGSFHNDADRADTQSRVTITNG